ncbi:hypothetical protein, partial [Novosphingobium sp. KN65.2]|uniref:hypothetical protein n=1 Tax=Novosphingobium sp. KN65.2 TaxID=1478134 RepID=UPI001E427E46
CFTPRLGDGGFDAIGEGIAQANAFPRNAAISFGKEVEQLRRGGDKACVCPSLISTITFNASRNGCDRDKLISPANVGYEAPALRLFIVEVSEPRPRSVPAHTRTSRAWPMAVTGDASR